MALEGYSNAAQNKHYIINNLQALWHRSEIVL